MKRSNNILFFCILMFIGFCSNLNAQDISESVIGTSGSYYNNLLFGNLHFTVGEVAVSRLEGDIILGEGFHRAYYDLIVDTKEVLPDDWEVNIYPNPTAERVTVKLPTETATSVQLFNTNGQLMVAKENQTSLLDIDMSFYPAGIYWLKLNDSDGRQAFFQIQKISL